MCSQTDDEPGPPLKVNVMGRVAWSVSSSVYATKKTRAFSVPSSSPSVIVPAVAEYESS